MTHHLTDCVCQLLGHDAARILAARHGRVQQGARTHESKSELTIIEDIVDRVADILMRCAGPDEIFPVYCKFAIRFIQDDDE